MKTKSLVAVFILMSVHLLTLAQKPIGPGFEYQHASDDFGRTLPRGTRIFLLDSAATYRLSEQFISTQDMNDVFTSGNYTKWTSSGGTGSVGSFSYGEEPSGTKDGSNTQFILTHTPSAGTLSLYLNGQRLKYTESYTIGNDTIYMVYPPISTDWLMTDYNY